MTITSQLLEAYVRCPTKCWLRCAGENATGNAYAAWVQAKNEVCRVEGIKLLIAEVPDGERLVASPTENLKAATWRMAADLPAQAPNIETRVPIVERAPSAGRGKAAQFIPIRFVWTNKVGHTTNCYWRLMPLHCRKRSVATCLPARSSTATTMQC